MIVQKEDIKDLFYYIFLFIIFMLSIVTFVLSFINLFINILFSDKIYHPILLSIFFAISSFYSAVTTLKKILVNKLTYCIFAV